MRNFGSCSSLTLLSFFTLLLCLVVLLAWSRGCPFAFGPEWHGPNIVVLVKAQVLVCLISCVCMLCKINSGSNKNGRICLDKLFTNINKRRKM